MQSSWVRTKNQIPYKTLLVLVFLFSALVSFILTSASFHFIYLYTNPQTNQYLPLLAEKLLLSLDLQIMSTFFILLLIVFIITYNFLINDSTSYNLHLSVNEFLTDLKSSSYYKIKDLSSDSITLINLSSPDEPLTYTIDYLEQNFKPLIIMPNDLFVSTRPELSNKSQFKVLSMKPSSISLISLTTGLDFEIPYTTFYKDFNPLIKVKDSP